MCVRKKKVPGLAEKEEAEDEIEYEVHNIDAEKAATDAKGKGKHAKEG